MMRGLQRAVAAVNAAFGVRDGRLARARRRCHVLSGDNGHASEERPAHMLPVIKYTVCV